MLEKDIIIADINFKDVINTVLEFVLNLLKNEFSEIFDIVGE